MITLASIPFGLLSSSQRHALSVVYEATTYAFEHDREGRVVVQLMHANPVVDRILGTYRAESFCFITAFNPAQVTGDAEYPEELNRAWNHLLEQELRARKLRYFSGAGTAKEPDAAGRIYSEPSFFVIGTSHDEALELGRMFKQNAVVFGVRGGAAELLWLR